MVMEDPLLTPKTTIAASNAPLDDKDAVYSSNSSVILRLLLIIWIGIISIWANHEASKGFGITLVNDAKETPEGKRFSLLYISSDKATGIIQNTSSFVENLLYTDINHTSKQVIHRVTLKLAGKNLPNLVTVDLVTNDHEFVISISPSILRDPHPRSKNLDYAITSTVLQGMARVWLWNSESMAPPWLLDGMVEYIKGLAGFGPVRNLGDHKSPGPLGHFCSGDKDPEVVAMFLDYCERNDKGFIQRLSKALKDDWTDHLTVEDAMGTLVQNGCDSYRNRSHGLSSWR